MNNLKLTSIEELRKKRQELDKGELVPLPSGLVFLLTRPNLSDMLEQGSVPAPLLGTALKMQSGFALSTLDDFKQSVKMVRLICKSAIKEPEGLTDEDVQALSDEDKTFIMNYVQRGARALDSFRDEQRSELPRPDSEEILDKTESNT